MSFLEIVAELPRLTPAQRDELSANLAMLQRVEDPAFLEEMDRRIDRMEAGESIASEQLDAALREQRHAP
jgi:hypothetical protein